MGVRHINYHCCPLTKENYKGMKYKRDMRCIYIIKRNRNKNLKKEKEKKYPVNEMKSNAPLRIINMVFFAKNRFSQRELYSNTQ